MNRKEGKDLVTVTQAARAKGLTRQSVLQAIQDGRLVATKYGEFYLIKQADLDAWTPQPRGPKRREREAGEA